jgi:sulfur carrier protein ThiS
MFGLRRSRVAKLLPAVVLAALLLPATAFGQATRTWVSGVGDDANPCSRTAPCKTFAGAISKTAAGGIIDAMDDGGFGALTITKAITVDGGHHIAGVLASGGINAINVAAGVNDKIVLRRLDIEGNGTTLGLNGVRITQAKSVRIEESFIHDFSRSGVAFEPGNPNAKLFVNNTAIANNGGNGVTIAPLSAGTGAKAMLHDNTIEDNTCGVVAATFGMTNVWPTECGTATSATGISAATDTTTTESSISFNSQVGVMVRGTGAVQRIGNNTITGNLVGLQFLGAPGQIISMGGNMTAGNGSTAAPSSTIPPV